MNSTAHAQSGQHGSDWQRVTRRRPCPVCEKPDWCLYTGDDDSPTAAICARVESEKRAGEGGWLHVLRTDGPAWPNWRQTVHVAEKKLLPEASALEIAKMAEAAAVDTSTERLQGLADELGISAASLRRLSVGWLAGRKAWGFPMRDAQGRITGIRLRLLNGKKLSVRGGKEGLFLSSLETVSSRLLICEGPSDCAALLDLGFQAIGRPSCSGGVRHILDLVRKRKPSEVVIVADDDGPGQRGAKRLASELVPLVKCVRVITPPDGINDAREWKRSGATAGAVEAAIQAVSARRLRIAVKGKVTQ